MHVNIQTSSKDNNSGSSADYTNYLEKENENVPENEQEKFFSHDRDKVESFEVIASIDENIKAKGAKEASFFSVILSPSQEELKHINNDKDKLKEFTRSAMDEYAAHFDKGLKGDDLVYFAKVEQQREYKGFDNEVKQGLAKQGQQKDGLQTHVHVMVSRRAKEKGYKISPLNNSKGNKKTKGFDRQAFKTKAEQTFDKTTDYKRAVEETYKYMYEQKMLSTSEKIQELLKPKIKEKEVEAVQEPTIEKEIQQQQEKEKNKDRGQSLDFPSM